MFALSCPLSLMSYNCRIQWPRVEGPPPPLSPHPGHSPGQGTRNLQCRDAFSPNPYYPSGGMVFDIALSIRECRFPVKPRPGCFYSIMFYTPNVITIYLASKLTDQITKTLKQIRLNPFKWIIAGHNWTWIRCCNLQPIIPP